MQYRLTRLFYIVILATLCANFRFMDNINKFYPEQKLPIALCKDSEELPQKIEVSSKWFYSKNFKSSSPGKLKINIFSNHKDAVSIFINDKVKNGSIQEVSENDCIAVFINLGDGARPTSGVNRYKITFLSENH